MMTRRLTLVSLLLLAILNGYGSRMAEPALGLIGSYLFSAPYEEVRLKGR
jgi:hypothetical protein